MLSNVSGITLKEVVNPSRIRGQLTEEDVVHRQLMRDVMSRIDFNDIKARMPQERRTFSEVHAAQTLPGARQAVFTLALEPIAEKIESVLIELKASEKKDTTRMRQIEARLAEFRAARKTGYFIESADADRSSPAIIDISESARSAYHMNKAK